jgi:DnaK suppressor protein
MPSNSHLSKTQRKSLLIALQTHLALLQRQHASHLEGMTQTEHAQNTLRQDADDTVQRAAAHEVEATISDINSDEFKEISNTLQRIHGADYGICTDCQAAIPFERLIIEPQTLRCVDCETLHESKN